MFQGLFQHTERALALLPKPVLWVFKEDYDKTSLSTNDFAKPLLFCEQDEWLAAASGIPDSIRLGKISLSNWSGKVYPLPVHGRKLLHRHHSLCFDARDNPCIKEGFWKWNVFWPLLKSIDDFCFVTRDLWKRRDPAPGWTNAQARDDSVSPNSFLHPRSLGIALLSFKSGGVVGHLTAQQPCTSMQ